MVVQVFQHLDIIGAGGMAAVQQLHQQADRAVRLKVAVDQLVPAVALGVGHLGIAVAGQIDKVRRVNAVKIDGRGLAGGGADARQIFAVAQLVDQARLAHVASAGKHDLRAVAFGQLA